MKRILPWFLSFLLLTGTGLLFSGCAEKTASIQIAAKDFTEQYILGEMLKLLVEENTVYSVELSSGIAGETSIIMPAMEKGDFDLYPEYDSTAWMTVLKQPKIHDTEEMHRKLQEEYNRRYDMQWLGYYGFDNTYGIAVRKETAEKYHLKTYSDLADAADQLIFGAGYEFFEREDGYDGFQELYGFDFREIKEMNLSLKYNALLDGQVDAITIYKTDGRMENPDLVELEDDKNYFPPAMGGTVIRGEVLEKYPELKETLSMLNGKITNEEMRAMNAAVDLNGEDPKAVAAKFLREKGLIPDDQ
ncbi:MAG: glycine betaine ABC transporter substrate-binding protein [Clostridia bacterium]